MHFKSIEIFLSMSENSGVFLMFYIYQHTRGVFKDDRFTYPVLVKEQKNYSRNHSQNSFSTCGLDSMRFFLKAIASSLIVKALPLLWRDWLFIFLQVSFRQHSLWILQKNVTNQKLTVKAIEVSPPGHRGG